MNYPLLSSIDRSLSPPLAQFLRLEGPLTHRNIQQSDPIVEMLHIAVTLADFATFINIIFAMHFPQHYSADGEL